jgi:hypothetical protein
VLVVIGVVIGELGDAAAAIVTRHLFQGVLARLTSMVHSSFVPEHLLIPRS